MLFIPVSSLKTNFMRFGNLWRKLKNKEDFLVVLCVLGVLLLSLGIALIKTFPPFATNLIILGSFLFYISVVALVFVIK
jgi:CHASE2 domain-containing sensor protein